jgi:citrate lyase subunit beta/citryl-CoA lyase
MSGIVDEARSLLFAPGSDPHKIERAVASDADIVVADLEDSVAPAEKDRARALVVEMLAQRPDGRAIIVRINSASSPWFEADLAAIEGLELTAVMLPKASREAVAALDDIGAPVVALVETAIGIRSAFEIASSSRVVALALGAADVGAELWLEARPDGQEIAYARSKLVVDSRAAGVRPPFDGVQLAVADDEALETESRLARSLGFRGKLCIHPRQVPIVNRIFSSTSEELEWATAVIAAYDSAVAQGRGALALDGALVDQALVRRAKRIIGRHTGLA